MRLDPASLGIGAAAAALALAATIMLIEPQEPEFLVPAEVGSMPEDIRPSVPLKADAAHVMELLLSNASPALGSPDAPLTMVEFGDYQCHFCNVFFHDTEHRIVSDYVDTGALRLVFKDFTIIGPDSVLAAHAAHCAQEQGAFWEYHDILYNNWDGEETGWASFENLNILAGETGINVASWRECMQDERYLGAIVASNNDARALGLDSTPNFFIIGADGEMSRISGAQPYEAFRQELDAMLQNQG